MKNLSARILLSLILLGFCKIASAQLTQLTFQNIDVWPKSNSYDSFRQIAQDSMGFLWFSSSDGVYSYDGHTLKDYYFSDDSSGLRFNRTELMHVDSSGGIWVGLISGEVKKYNAYKDAFEMVISSKEVIGGVFDIFEDKSRRIWIPSEHGLSLFNPENGSLSTYVPNEPPSDPRGYNFRAVIQDRFNNDLFWVGGLEGLHKFYPKTGKFEIVSTSIINPHTEKGYMLMDLNQDEEGLIYIGTWGGGVISYNSKSGEWIKSKVIDVDGTNLYAVVHSLIPKDLNSFWIASLSGIGIFSKGTREDDFYQASDQVNGALQTSRTYRDIHVTTQGNLVVTRANGFSISSGVRELGIQKTFSPVVTSILVDNAPLQTDTSFTHLNLVELGPENRDVSFVLSTPGYFGSMIVEYQYRLVGYDNDWILLDNSNTVRYTNLNDANDYVFEFKTSTNGGDSWVSGNSVSIRKTVLFWQNWYIKAGALILFIAFVLLVYYLRIQSIKKREKFKADFNRKAAELELIALRSQMNPHFMFNSLNSIKHYILTHEPLKAAEYLTNFATLIRSTLHNSNEKLIPLSKEIETLLLYIELEQLRFKNKFEFSCFVEPNIDMDNVLIPPLILQPYVENAIWHGLMHKEGPGILNLSIDISGEVVKCRIEDDGIGRSAAEKLKSKSATNNKSMGIGITQSRIDIHNKMNLLGIVVDIVDKCDSNGKSVGTLVTIDIPMTNDLRA